MLTKLLPIKFAPEQYQQLKELAEGNGVSMAEIVRQATQKEIAKRKQRYQLSDFAQYARDFPKETQSLTDDELLYG